MSAARRTYVIQVAGHLDDHWTSLLDGSTLARNADGTSTLTCPVADQAQLHGVLAGLRDIGATLLELRPATPRTADVEGSTPTAPATEAGGRRPGR